MTATAASAENLSALAERHLWGQFTTLKSGLDYTRVIDRGEGCYVWDVDGNRYLGGLAGLFVSQLGHGRPELAEAAGKQAETLGRQGPHLRLCAARSDARQRPGGRAVRRGAGDTFLHGLTFAGHPVSCAVALANLDLFEREDLLDHVLANESRFREALDDLLDLPIVGDIRGAGFFYGIELVKDRDTRETFSADEFDRLLRGFLSNRLLDLGLICRADDRCEPVIQLSPPLIAGQDEFDMINSILR